MPIQITSTQSPTLTDLAAPAVITSPPVVIAILGDSNFVGFAANAENATGFRLTLQRVLAEHGVNFRMVGNVGYGALAGTGTTWGKYPVADDFHDARKFILRDWRSDGFSGRRILKSSQVASVNQGTATFTANDHTLGNGSPVVHTVSAGGTLPTMSTVQTIYFAVNVSGATYQLAAYQSGPALTCSDAGSGTLTAHEGLYNLTPYVFANHDVAATDIIIGGGTNDCVELITTLGMSVTDAFEVLKARAIAYYAAIQAARPYARKYVIGLLPFTTGVTNATSLQQLRNLFNAWLASYVPDVLAKQYPDFDGGTIPIRGDRWTFVNAAANITAAEMGSDGVHPLSTGYQIYGTAIALAVVRGCGAANTDERWPKLQTVTRAADPWVELRATTDRITIANQASLAPGSDNFFGAIDFYPFELALALGVIVEEENPYTNGMMIAAATNNLVMYWKSASTVIPSSSYTPVLKRFRRNQIFWVGDFAKQQAALFLNGQLVQRVVLSAAAITSSTGWTIGAVAGLNSAPGLYRRFMYGHGTSFGIEDAPRMAQRYFDLFERPAGVTAEYRINEGSGTTIAGILQGSTSGTLAVTTGGWVTTGRYLVQGDEGYVPPAWDQQIRTITAAYTAAAGEFVKYDGSATGFTITIPPAINAGGREILLKDVVGGTNTITIAPSSGTVGGGANITRAVSGAITKLTPNGTDWVVTQ